MPTVDFRVDGQRATVECDPGACLRDALLAADLPVHNGPRLVSCHGLGSCGTCAVAVAGDVTPPDRRERARLRIPPHDPDGDLRLACQLTVTDDLRVRKRPGFWGHHKSEDDARD